MSICIQHSEASELLLRDLFNSLVLGCMRGEGSLVAQSFGMSVLLLILTPFAVSIVAGVVLKFLETPISNTLSSWFGSSLRGGNRGKQS